MLWRRLTLASLLLFSVGCRELLVTGVSPAIVGVGSEAEVTVTGAGFADGLSLALNNGVVDVTLGGVVVDNEETARGTVPAAAPVGVYDVVAELEGAVGQLDDALEVTDARTRLVFVDVGQGDATLVIAPGGETLLIDGGPPGSASELRLAIDRYAAGRLDAVVLSHFDADHLAGLVELLAGPDGTAGNGDDLVPALRFGPLDDMDCTTQTCGRYRALAGYPFRVAQVGDTLALGSAAVDIVAADGDVGGGAVAGISDNNEHSVVVRVAFGGRTALITGDLTGGGAGTVDLETPLAEHTGPVDVLRVSHHGSQTSSAQSALTRWAPRLAVFSLGTDNSYCHPFPDVLSRVGNIATRIAATGAGIVTDIDRCGAATQWPANASSNLGDVIVELSADGSLTLQDEPL